MAALNTIRTKGGVLVAVVISLSLLAFLLGDLTSTSGSVFGSSNQNVGTIMGTEISIQEYSNKVDEISLTQQMLSGTESKTEEESNQIRTQAWDQIIRTNIFGENLNELGLVVSEEESIDMVKGEYVSSILRSIFVNRETGGYDYPTVSNVIKNIGADSTGRTAKFWSYIENEMAMERSLSKYFSLVENGIYTTSNEVDQIVAASNTNYNFNFITKPTYMIADSLVTVTDDEVRKYYSENKDKFKSVSTRTLEYVVYEALPSEEDYKNAQEDINEITAEFNKADDLVQFVNLNANTNFDARFKKAEELPTELAQFAFGKEKASTYGPVLAGDIYTIAKVVETKNLPDTLGAKHILVAATDRQLADSLVKVLKKDKSKFAELASKFSMDQNANLSGGDLGRFHMSQMIPEFSNGIVDSYKGAIISVDTQFGIHVIEVTEIGTRYPKVQLAVVDYVINPSNVTNQLNYTKATQFADMISDTKVSFDDATSELGVSKRAATIRAGERNIEGLDNTTEIVRWAFNNEKGAISEVISIGEQNIVAKVRKSSEHGIKPVEDVVFEIKNILRSEKKAEYIKAKLEGATTLAEMATKLDVEVQTAKDINFKSFYIPSLGAAPKVVGALTTMKQGDTSNSIVTTNNVSVIEVTAATPAENTNAKQEEAVLQSAAETSFQQRVMASVYAVADVNDMRVMFF